MKQKSVVNGSTTGGENMICDCPVKLTIPKSFIKYIEDNCIVDEIDGQLYCKHCRNRVIVDYFEKQLECTGCDEL